MDPKILIFDEPTCGQDVERKLQASGYIEEHETGRNSALQFHTI